MRAIQPENRRRSRVGTVPMTFVAFAIGAVVVVGGLWIAGVDLPFLSRGIGFHVAIPINAREIAPYSRVSREDLWDPQLKSLAYLRLPPQKVIGMSLLGRNPQGQEVRGPITQVIDQDGVPIFALADGSQIPLNRTVKVGDALMQPSDIVNRVVRQQKPAGYGFQEEEFFPVGTKPGVAAATPAGKRALTLDANRLIGAHALNINDRVELVANIPVEKLAQFDQLVSAPNRLPGASLVLPRHSRSTDQTETRVIALDAIVLQPITKRFQSDTSSSLTQGRVVQQLPVEEVVLAVVPDEATRLTEAISLGAKVNCLVRSRDSVDGPADTAPEGMVAVPVVGRPITAYDRLTKEDLIDLRTRRHRVEYMTTEEVAEQQVVVNVERLIGRVISRDKVVGEVLRLKDLMPPGTIPGLEGAVPAGMRLISLDADKIDGVDSLRFRQRIDLIASTPVDWSKLQVNRGTSRLISGSLTSATLQQQFQVESVVVNGMVIAPVNSLANPSTIASLQESTPGKQATQQIMIAVTPEESIVLRSKISMNADFTVVPLTEGDDEQASQPVGQARRQKLPRIDPLENVRTIETITGRNRQTVIFVPDADGRSKKFTLTGEPSTETDIETTSNVDDDEL